MLRNLGKSLHISILLPFGRKAWLPRKQTGCLRGERTPASTKGNTQKQPRTQHRLKSVLPGAKRTASDGRSLGRVTARAHTEGCVWGTHHGDELASPQKGELQEMAAAKRRVTAEGASGRPPLPGPHARTTENLHTL